MVTTILTNPLGPRRSPAALCAAGPEENRNEQTTAQNMSFPLGFPQDPPFGEQTVPALFQPPLCPAMESSTQSKVAHDNVRGPRRCTSANDYNGDEMINSLVYYPDHVYYPDQFSYPDTRGRPFDSSEGERIAVATRVFTNGGNTQNSREHFHSQCVAPGTPVQTDTGVATPILPIVANTRNSREHFHSQCVAPQTPVQNHTGVATNRAQNFADDSVTVCVSSTQTAIAGPSGPASHNGSVSIAVAPVPTDNFIGSSFLGSSSMDTITKLVHLRTDTEDDGASKRSRSAQPPELAHVVPHSIADHPTRYGPQRSRSSSRNGRNSNPVSGFVQTKGTNDASPTPTSDIFTIGSPPGSAPSERKPGMTAQDLSTFTQMMRRQHDEILHRHQLEAKLHLDTAVSPTSTATHAVSEKARADSENLRADLGKMVQAQQAQLAHQLAQQQQAHNEALVGHQLEAQRLQERRDQQAASQLESVRSSFQNDINQLHFINQLQSQQVDVKLQAVATTMVQPQPTTIVPSSSHLSSCSSQLPTYAEQGREAPRAQIDSSTSDRRDKKDKKEKKDKRRGNSPPISVAGSSSAPQVLKAPLSDPPAHPQNVGGGGNPGGGGGGGNDNNAGDQQQQPARPTSHARRSQEHRGRRGDPGGDDDDGNSSSSSSDDEHPKRGGHRDGGDGDDGGSSGAEKPSRRKTRHHETLIVSKYKEADRISLKPCGHAGLARKWKMTVREEVTAASGRGQLVYEWILEVEKVGQSFDGLADSGLDFVSLDSKLSVAIGSVVSGDVAQDIFNRMETLGKNGKMITGRQKYFVYLSHLHYDVDHGSTYNILSLTNLAFEGDTKLAHFLRRYDEIINGLSEPISENVLRLNLYEKIKNSTLLQHDLAWFKRAADPSDDNHQKVRTHDWLLKVIRGRIKAAELEINASSVLKSLSHPASSVPGAVGAQATESKKDKKAKEKTYAAAAYAAGPDKGKGKGKGKGKDQPRTAPVVGQPPSTERLATLDKYSKEIKDQGLCLYFNKGKCTRSRDDCKFKHTYFSFKSIAGNAAPAAARPPLIKKEYTPKELAERAKTPCPFVAKPSGCTFGDKCHYNHEAKHGGVALAHACIAKGARR